MRSVPITLEVLEALASAGHATYAEELAREQGIELPAPLTFDCSLEEFRARMPELELRLR